MVHVLFVGFTVVGGFLAWLMPWVFIPHLAAALWGGRMAATDAACPLSRLEDWGREGAGKPRIDLPLRDRHGHSSHSLLSRCLRHAQFHARGREV